MNKKEIDLKNAILAKTPSRDKEVIKLLLEYIDKKLEIFNELKVIENINEEI